MSKQKDFDNGIIINEILGIKNLRIRRLMLMFLDYFLLGFFFVPILIINELALAKTNPELESNISNTILLLFLLAYLNKDFFKGKSLGKRFFGYQVIDIKSKKVASELQCFIRNLTIYFLLPIEIVVSFIYPNKRIGDLLANTELVEKESEKMITILSEIKSTRFKNDYWVIIIIGILYSLFWVKTIS